MHSSKAVSLVCLLTLKLSLYLDSNTDIAASEPDPIVANGRVLVDMRINLQKKSWEIEL